MKVHLTPAPALASKAKTPLPGASADYDAAGEVGTEEEAGTRDETPRGPRPQCRAGRCAARGHSLHARKARSCRLLA